MSKIRLQALVAIGVGSLAGLVGVTTPAAAAVTTQTFGCDRASECSSAFFPLEINGTFDKLFGYTVRAGGPGAEREYAVEDQNDSPISHQGQATQSLWSSGPSDHSFAFGYDPGNTSATVTLSDGPAGVTFSQGPVTASNVPGPSAGINALALRASTDADNQGRKATLTNLTITIGGTTHSLTQLVGDGNAEYLLVLSDDLASGFEIGGDALFNPNGSLRSTVAYQAKVGVVSGELTDVPVPATAALLALGLIGLGVGTRVRRQV